MLKAREKIMLRRHVHNKYSFRRLLSSVVILLPLMIGCATQPDAVGTKPNPIGLLGLSGTSFDTASVDAVLEFTFFSRGRINVGIIDGSRADAAFTDDFGVVYPTIVRCNGAGLMRNPDGLTCVDFESTLLSGSACIWQLGGYDNGTLNDTSSDPPLLTFSGVTAGDTVSKSAGFTLSYTGYSGGELWSSVIFDGVETLFYKDSAASENGSGSASKTTMDNGTIAFSAADLSNFTTDDYIVVHVLNYTYHRNTTSTGKSVGILSTRDVSIPLYLKP